MCFCAQSDTTANCSELENCQTNTYLNFNNCLIQNYLQELDLIIETDLLCHAHVIITISLSEINIYYIL
jgi:hypothetical protein